MTSMARKRNPTLAAPRQGYDAVNAETYQQLYDSEDSSSSKFPSMQNPWIRISGRNAEQPTWGALCWAFLMEMAGCWLVGTAVALVKQRATSSDTLANGFYVAIAYGVSLLVASRWNHSYVLRRHLNGAVTLGYFLTNQIGLFGVLFYTVAQWCGIFIAGATVHLALSAETALASIDAIPVPFPVDTTAGFKVATTLLIVVFAEIFVGAFIVFVQLYNEFVNTDESTPEARDKNYKRASVLTAVTTAIVVLFLFQFQIYSFSTVVYGAGLTSGFNMPLVARDGSTIQLSARDTVNLAQMFPPASGCNASIDCDWYTDSVFVAGRAWALYLWAPYAAAIAGALLFLVVFWFAATKSDKRFAGNARTLRQANTAQQVDDAQVNAFAGSAYASASAPPKQAHQLLTPFANSL